MDEGLLITLVEGHPNLYDKNRPDFKNAVKRENSWDEVANAMGQSQEDCQRVWLNLRTRFGKELRKKKVVPSGSSAQEEEWALFNSLKFLETHIRPRKTTSNVRPASRSSSSMSGWDSYSEITSPQLVVDEEQRDSQITTPEAGGAAAPAGPSSMPTAAEEMAAASASGKTPLRKRKVITTLPMEEKIGGAADAISAYLKTAHEEEETAEAAFAKYVHLSIKRLPKKVQNKAKMEIMEVLSKYESDSE